VDNYVFPGLDRSRESDGLEARFNAFKIPESNFLVFEATVKTCREGCQPAYCTGQTGRSEPSFGRRRRDTSEMAVGHGNLTEVTTVNYTSSTTLKATPTPEPPSTTSTTMKAEVKPKRAFASTTIKIPTDQVGYT